MCSRQLSVVRPRHEPMICGPARLGGAATAKLSLQCPPMNQRRYIKHAQFSSLLPRPLNCAGRCTFRALLFTQRSPAIFASLFKIPQNSSAQRLRHFHHERTQSRSADYPLLGRWRLGLGRLPGMESLRTSCRFITNSSLHTTVSWGVSLTQLT